METGRENFKNDRVTDGVTDGVTDYESIEYSSYTLANTVDQTNGSEWSFVTISRNGKKMWTEY